MSFWGKIWPKQQGVPLASLVFGQESFLENANVNTSMLRNLTLQ